MATLTEDVAVTCTAMPVQIQGHLRDGRWFYFRARGERAQLGASASLDGAVAATCSFPHDDPWHLVQRDLSHLGQYGAGLIDIPEAFALLVELADELPDP